MNHIVDFEARTLATLLASGDILGMRMFMERMQMPWMSRTGYCIRHPA